MNRRSYWAIVRAVKKTFGLSSSVARLVPSLLESALGKTPTKKDLTSHPRIAARITESAPAVLRGKRAAETRARKDREKFSREVEQLTETLRQKQKISKVKARGKAIRIVTRTKEANRLARAMRRQEEKKAASLPKRTVEYEVKVGYSRKGKNNRKERGANAVLVNFRFQWSGRGEPPSDKLLREYAFQSLRVEGAAVSPQFTDLGFEWAWVNWANGKASRGWRSQLEMFAEDESSASTDKNDLTAFADVVETVGRDGIEIGEVQK